MGEKIMVALSGGVDSAVAMLLLKQGGAEVSAAYMKTWMNEEGIDVFGDCPWHQDILDAEACAERAGVPFEVVDFIREYREQVVDYMVGEYRAGRTPNPDAMCNRKMKFGKFLEYAKARGFSKVATGHYCQDRLNGDGSKDLLMGADPGKDQSYFLAMITQSQLQSAVFPIGSLLKSQVRDLARMNALPNCDKKDSQGICFLGKIRIQDFLSRHIPEKRGDIVNAAGRKVGEHSGLFNYTIGQRRGIRVPSNADGKRYVVVAKDYEANILRVDFDSPEAKNLYSTSAVIGGINWINKKLDSPARVEARVRYRDGLVGAKFTPLSEDSARVDFDVPQRALAAGQILALHLPPVVLGGGFVESVS